MSKRKIRENSLSKMMRRGWDYPSLPAKAQTIQEKGVIRGSTVIINPKKSGYPAMTVFMIGTSSIHVLANETIPVDSSLILDALIKMRNIIVATKTVGDHDLLAIGVIMDFEHLINVRNEIAKIPGIKDLKVSFWTEKNRTLPQVFCHLNPLKP